MPTTTQNTNTNLSDEQRGAINNRTNLLTGFLGSIPGANPSDPWAGAGAYFGGQFSNKNPYDYSPSAGFSNPLLRDTSKFYADQMGKIQTPQINYTPQANTYNPVDLSSANASLGQTMGNMGGVNVDRTDPQAAIAAAQDIMSQIITPGVRAQLASSGMGRTGAEAEITSQRGAELALPIASQTQGEHARANELQASLAMQGKGLQAQLAQVQYLKSAEAQLQAQTLTARDASELRTIQAQLASVQAQLQQSTQAISAAMAGKGLDAGVSLANSGAAYGLANQRQQQDFALNLLRGTPLPGGGSQQTSTDTPSNLAGNLMNLVALAGLAGGGQYVTAAVKAGVKSVGQFVDWLKSNVGQDAADAVTQAGGFGSGFDPVTGNPIDSGDGFGAGFDPVSGMTDPASDFLASNADPSVFF